MNKEEFFISGFNSKFIGDDGAFIDNFVYSKDLFCEGIHFKREWMSLKEIAKKSMLVNISDAFSMNAKPKFALLGIVLPKSVTKVELKEIFNSLKETAKEYGIEIIGGDTVAGEKLCFSITIISTTNKPLYRKGLKEGDIFAYSGTLGGVKKDLTRAFRGGKLGKNSRFKEPILRGDFIFEASKYMTTALDISDSLSKDLSRVCKINRLGVKFFKKLPKSLLCSGEEYEVLFSFNKRNLTKIESIAKKHRVKITPFGMAVRGKYKTVCKENHF